MMNKSKKNVTHKIVPYLVMGVVIAIAVACLILIVYLFVWGIFIGLGLWALMAIKEKFFSSHSSSSTTKKGRVIDMEDPAEKKR